MEKTGIINHRKFDRKVRLLSALSRMPVLSTFALTRLVKLRFDTFFETRWTTETSISWPRQFPESTVGGPGIPEASRSAVSVSDIGSGITRNGAFIVRGLVQPSQIALLRKSIQSAYDSHDRSNGDLTFVSEWFTPFQPDPIEGVDTTLERNWFRGSGAVLAADSPRGLFNLLKCFEESGIVDIVEEYLGERPALSVRKTSLRRVDADQTETGWHQDGAFLGTDIRTINVWIALSDCGDDAPSMEMVPKRLNEIAPTGTPGALMSWTVSPEVVAEVAGDTPPVHLKFSAGDAIFFDEMNLHRTSSRPHFSKPRYAIEAWFFAPSCYPLDQLPLLV